MQVNRIFPFMMLGTLVAATPLAAARGDMTVAAFLARPIILNQKGFWHSVLRTLPCFNPKPRLPARHIGNV
jgi:hypothetical protein